MKICQDEKAVYRFIEIKYCKQIIKKKKFLKRTCDEEGKCKSFLKKQ